MDSSRKYAAFFAVMCLMTSFGAVAAVKTLVPPSTPGSALPLARATEEVAPEPTGMVILPAEPSAGQPTNAAYDVARGLLENSIGKLDWFYTLRAGVDYDALSNLRAATKNDFASLSHTLETGTDNEVINSKLCLANQDIATLQAILAPGSDATQPNVDALNEQVLSDMHDALQVTENDWSTATGLNLNCR